jgi:hypothetical protein
VAVKEIGNDLCWWNTCWKEVCLRRAVASVSRNVLTRHLPRLRWSELAYRSPQKTVSSR